MAVAPLAHPFSTNSIGFAPPIQSAASILSSPVVSISVTSDYSTACAPEPTSLSWIHPTSILVEVDPHPPFHHPHPSSSEDSLSLHPAFTPHVRVKRDYPSPPASSDDTIQSTASYETSTAVDPTSWSHMSDPTYSSPPPFSTSVDLLTGGYSAFDPLSSTPAASEPSSSSVDHLWGGNSAIGYSSYTGPALPRTTPAGPVGTAEVDATGVAPAASRCISSWHEYQSGWTTYSANTTVPPQYDVTTSSFKNPTSVPFTTLCDHIPRAPANVPEYLTQTFTTTKQPASTGSTSTNTLPVPTCSVGADQCFALSDRYSLGQASGGEGFKALSPNLGPCQNSQNCKSCEIRGKSVELFYWPVETTPDSPCAGNASTITPTPTGSGPNTIVTRGLTFTSPSVYLSFGYLVGVSKTAGEPVCGQPTSDILVSIPPESLSSVRTISADASATVTTLPFNYADMNAVPKDVYQGMARCWPKSAAGNVCSTVYDDYSPHLVIPAAIRKLVPFWQHCDPCLEGVLDPPIPLTKEDSLFPRAAPTAAFRRSVPQSGFVSSTKTGGIAAAPTRTSEALPSESAFAQYTDKTPPPAGPPVPVSVTRGPWRVPENSTAVAGGEVSGPVEDGSPTTTGCTSSHSTVPGSTELPSVGGPPAAHGEGTPVPVAGGRCPWC